MSRRLAAAMLTCCVISACSHDWDAFDPRLGASGGGGGGGAPPTSTNGSTGNMTVSSSTSTPTSTSDTTTTSVSAGGGGSGPGQVEYAAAVADCINPGLPDPDACALEVGQNRMTVDSEFDAISDPTPRHVYLRFNLDGILAGKTIDAVNVRLHVPDTNGSNSTHSGDMWEVAPFDRQALFVGPPAQVGSSPISPNLGAVGIDSDVLFPLPTDSVTAGGSVYLGILPLSTNGVDYLNNGGSEPPALVVDYH
jgi:hypothetical protein